MTLDDHAVPRNFQTLKLIIQLLKTIYFFGDLALSWKAILRQFSFQHKTWKDQKILNDLESTQPQGKKELRKLSSNIIGEQQRRCHCNILSS